MKPQQLINDLQFAEQPLLVAASAGIDSMVLLDALYRGGADVVACYIDHGQRPNEIEQEKTMLAEYCQARDIDFFIRSIDLSLYERRDNEQSFFRTERYRLLAELAHELHIPFIATGHHLDDQGETQLMRLVKNYDVPSLRGIQMVRQVDEQTQIIRPLLHLRKDDIVSYANAFGLPYTDDSSNAGNKYFRNKLRHDVIPILEAENERFVPDLIEKVNDFVAYETYVSSELQKLMEATLAEGNIVDQAALMSIFERYDETLQRLIVRLLLRNFLGYTDRIKQQKVKEIVSCLKTQPKKTAIELKDGVSFGIQYGKIFLMQTGVDVTAELKMRLGLGDNVMASFHIICAKEEAIASAPWQTIVLPEHVFDAGIYLRFPQENDYIPLKKGKKKLNRLYIDEKVLPHERFRTPVVATEDNLIIYDVCTGKVGFFNSTTSKKDAKKSNVYVHIKKRI